MRQKLSLVVAVVPVVALFIIRTKTVFAFTLVFPASERAYTNRFHRNSNGSPLLMLEMSISSDARDFLYQDQQLAMERRAFEEEALLNTSGKPTRELTVAKVKPKPPKSGRGFGRSSRGSTDDNDDSLEARIAVEQAKIIQRDGVIRINDVLSDSLADELRTYVLKQRQLAAEAVSASNNSIKVSKTFYGVENSRKNRCDLQLSLLRGGYNADCGRQGGFEDEPHTVADALHVLLGRNGSLRPVFSELVTDEGEFYELAAVITDPGSKRQMFHADLPWKVKAPLYVIFVALQDTTIAMGPTTFLLGTHTKKETEKFLSGDLAVKNEQFATAKARVSTLSKGDAVLFDARILHCGNANSVQEGSTRVLFNFSFRNPVITENLGYPGSIRPGYCSAMTLGDLSNCLDNYSDTDGETSEPFEEYGDGLV